MSRSGPVWRRIPLWAYVLGLVIIAAGTSVPLYLSQRGPADSTAPLGVASVGEPAPGFVLNDPYGQTYALTPGDGRVHVLVFYMGNF